jgi:porin
MEAFQRIKIAIIAVIALLCTVPIAVAEEMGKAPYSGDFLARPALTGDWGGVRNYLAQKGITLDMNVLQTAQGVVSGGTDSTWEFGGRGNLTLKMDTGKMGLWPGGFLTAEFEGSWSRGVNRYTGALMSVNSSQLYPVPAQDGIGIPALNFAQFLSEYVGLVAGKLETVSNGDQNEFAHGKGDINFMNLAFNVNPVLLMTVPYSTLGAGLIVLPTKDPKAAVVSLMAVSAIGSADTTGFSDMYSDKMTFVGEARIRTNFLGKTGHQLVGYTYSNKDFTSINQRLESLVDRQLNKVNSSWAFYYNFDQYLYETSAGSGKGIGVFGRFGASDGIANPVHYFYSVGVGSNGLIPGRPLDRFGLGYYYMDVANITLQTSFGTREFLRDEQGFEAFYNIAITPWAQLTPNIQIVKGARSQILNGSLQDISTATVLGLRLNLVF